MIYAIKFTLKVINYIPLFAQQLRPPLGAMSPEIFQPLDRVFDGLDVTTWQVNRNVRRQVGQLPP
jgi:hypothetical protein